MSSLTRVKFLSIIKLDYNIFFKYFYILFRYLFCFFHVLLKKGSAKHYSILRNLRVLNNIVYNLIRGKTHVNFKIKSQSSIFVLYKRG